MEQSQRIRVLIVDDHPLMRAGICGEIDAQNDMMAVGQADDGETAIALYRQLRPDITLMDLKMPRQNGMDCLQSIRKEFPRARVVILTTATGDIQARRALQLGAVGFLLKDTLRSELVKAIRAVHTGGRYIPDDVAREIAGHFVEDALSGRELEVLQSVAGGRSNKIIASELAISEHTVKNHVKSILSKLSAADRTHAVTIALRRGYIEL